VISLSASDPQVPAPAAGPPAADAPSPADVAKPAEAGAPGESASVQTPTSKPVSQEPSKAVIKQTPLPGEAPTVSVQDVSITYRTTFEKVPTFKSAIVRFGRGERAVREVHAVQNISFDVPRGTALGII